LMKLHPDEGERPPQEKKQIQCLMLLSKHSKSNY
jgi:hypothetical protein